MTGKFACSRVFLTATTSQMFILHRESYTAGNVSYFPGAPSGSVVRHSTDPIFCVPSYSFLCALTYPFFLYVLSFVPFVACSLFHWAYHKTNSQKHPMFQVGGTETSTLNDSCGLLRHSSAAPNSPPQQKMWHWHSYKRCTQLLGDLRKKNLHYLFTNPVQILLMQNHTYNLNLSSKFWKAGTATKREKKLWRLVEQVLPRSVRRSSRVLTGARPKSPS